MHIDQPSCSAAELAGTLRPGSGLDELNQIRAAAARILRDSQAGREVVELCNEHADARSSLLDDPKSGLLVIAVVGAIGQGKTWLIRQLIRKSSSSRRLASGSNRDEATKRLTCVGPGAPKEMDAKRELFIHCKAAEMESIGTPYVLIDAPGCTDDHRSLAAVTQRAMSLASAVLLVVRRDQIRGAAPKALLAHANSGTYVIPVVTAVQRRDASLDADTDSLVARCRQAGTEIMVASPVLVDDFDAEGQDEESIGAKVATTVAERLRGELGSLWEGDQHSSARLAELDRNFRTALHDILADQLPGLAATAQNFEHEVQAILGEIAMSLVDCRGSLQTVVRRRLRAALLARTHLIWVPYRVTLNLLILMQSLWEYLQTSLSPPRGSLMSAVSNRRGGTAIGAAARDELQKRAAAAAADRLGPLASRFREEMALSRQRPIPEASVDPSILAETVRLSGIETLERNSAEIVEEESKRMTISAMSAQLCGALGTAIFLFLVAGPVVALYRDYLAASYLTLGSFGGGGLQSFPDPSLSMLLTSLSLAYLPTALLALLVISLLQSHRRVAGARQRIRARLQETIADLQQEGILQLHWDEPLLTDAKILMLAASPNPFPAGNVCPCRQETVP